VSVDWIAKAERYIADGEQSYALWALSGALGRFRKADDLDGLKTVLEMAEGLRPSLQDRRYAQHCNIITGGARDSVRFLTYTAEVGKLVELRDAGAISPEEFLAQELPDDQRALLTYLTEHLSGHPVWALAPSDRSELPGLQAAAASLLDRGLVSVFRYDNGAIFLTQPDAKKVLLARATWDTPPEHDLQPPTWFFVCVSPAGFALAESNG
jgi:hypothetical protein